MAKRRRAKRRLAGATGTVIGAPPGVQSVASTGPTPPIQVLCYGKDGIKESVASNIAKAREFAGVTKPPVTWINVDGASHGDTLRELGTEFGIHPLALEDVAHAHQRPKAEDYGDHLFLVLRTHLSPMP